MHRLLTNPLRTCGGVLFCMTTIHSATWGQQFTPNYDEAAVAAYKLPDPLVNQTGLSVTDPADWQQRRGEILGLFQEHVYGVAPDPVPVHATVVSTNNDAVDGKAIRREIDLTLENEGKSLTLSLLLYTPAGATQPVPCFLGLNFHGNHTLETDPSIRLPNTWVRSQPGGITEDHRATDAGRGTRSKSWPVDLIVDQGYALATVYYGDIDPDFDDGFENGIHGLFQHWAKSIELNQRWGSIAGWAYGLSRVLDYLQTDPLVDGQRVAVVGHSRLGKTALWAGATDPRFKLVISNNSGSGGAALSRRVFGETVGRINTSFPHWFNQQFKRYNKQEGDLPVDQHQLIALIAPRAVYVASATEDRWADPRGEFLACVHADPVYRLLGTNGLGGAVPPNELPPPDRPIAQGTIGYHLRTGPHALTQFDWLQYLRFAQDRL